MMTDTPDPWLTANWREIADVLAERMHWHAHCETHRTPQPDDCPFCKDRVAYAAYREAVRDA